MQRIGRQDAITREQFDSTLREWLETAQAGEWIGDRQGRGQAPWVFVRVLGRLYHLNADSNREGVREYVGMLAVDSELAWTIVPNQKGRQNKVAFGSEQRKIPRFFFYVVLPR